MALQSLGRAARWTIVAVFTLALLVVTGYVVVQLYDGEPRALISARGLRAEVYFAIGYGLLLSIGPQFRWIPRKRQNALVWWTLTIAIPIIGVLYEADVFGTRRGVSLTNLSVFALFAAMIIWSWKVFRLLDTSDRLPKQDDLPPDLNARVRNQSELILKNPGDASAYLKRGHAYRDAKQFVLAAADFESAQRLGSSASQAHQEPKVRQPTDADEKALAGLVSEIAATPDGLAVHGGRAAALYMSFGRQSEAIELMSEIVRRYPTADNFAGRAECLMQCGRDEEALTDFSRAIDLEVSSDRLHFFLICRALLESRLGKFQDALADMSRCMSGNEESPTYYAARAQVYEAMGDLVAARRDTEKMSRLSEGRR